MQLSQNGVSFGRFFKHCFSASNASVNLDFAWHIQHLIRVLSNITLEGSHKRVIISLPPRALKSQIVSVAWPAWLLGKNPSARIMTASYSQTLSEKHSLDCRHIIQSSQYQNFFPNVQLASDQNEKSRFATTARGYRMATSVGGTATGDGGNILIVDDPHNANHIYSATRRKKVIDWFENTWMSRLDNKKDGIMIVVMQRLHEDDLAGHLLSKPNTPWKSIVFPTIAEEDGNVACSDGAYQWKKGDLLQPARESHHDLEQIKREIGSHNFAAQYQQSPLSAEGNSVKRDWLKLCKHDEVPDYDQVIQSWDTANNVKEHNDFSVCTTWGVHKAGYVLLNVYRDKLAYTDLLSKGTKLFEEWQPDKVLIENSASGQGMIEHLRRFTRIPVVPINPKENKLNRLMHVLPLFEAGKIQIVKQYWADDLISELLTFPYGKHDDQVDSISQFLNYCKKQSSHPPPKLRPF